MTLPDGYAAARAPHAWAFAVQSALPWLDEVLASGSTLHEWAAALDDRVALAGRGAVHSVPAPAPGPDARARWVVRHYYRGGAVARLLVDRYLAVGVPRPWIEARASMQARSRGIPTPAAVAGAVYPAGPFYRADLVTEEIPGGADLAAVVFQGVRDLDPIASLLATGQLVRRMEHEGLYHPDLNAKNVVLRSGPDGPQAHLVDLDRCCLREWGIPAPVFPMRDRLRRSLRKLGMRFHRALTSDEWKALRAGWEERP